MALLTAAEQQLCVATSEGRVAEFAHGEAISAEVIRRIVLGIEIEGQSSAVKCPAGVRVKGATIEGRIDLAQAGQGGSAAAALSLEDCLLNGGIDAGHAAFAALSLRDCRVSDDPALAKDGPFPPPIDLLDAHICGELELSGIKPSSDEAYCYIRAEGAQIDGNVDLAKVYLRAPAMKPDRPLDDGGTAALDLSLARIDGDLTMVGGPRLVGAVRMRCTEVTGDVWIAGAQFERAGQFRDGTAVPKESDVDACLFMQGMDIGGSVNIFGGSENRGGAGESRPVRVYGDLSLRLARIGEGLDLFGCRLNGSLDLSEASIGKSVRIVGGGFTEARVLENISANDLSAGADLTIGLPVDGNVSLFDAEVAGTLDLSLLDLPKGQLWLRSATIDRTLRVANQNTRSVRAGRAKRLASMPGFSLLETVSDGIYAGDRPVQAAFLVRGKEFWRLEGKSDLLHSLVGRFGHQVYTPEAAEEYLRLFCNYLEGPDGYFRVLAPDPEISLGLKLDLSGHTTTLGHAKELEDPAHRDRAVIALERALEVSDFDELARELFPLRCVGSHEGVFVFEAAMVYVGDVYRCQLQLDASQPNAIRVDMLADEPTGLVIANAPRVGTVFIEPGGDAGAIELPGGFVTAPTVAGMEPARFGSGATKLLPQIQSGFVVRGSVDLAEARCGTLDDMSGLAWGETAQIDSNHFEYGRANWSQSAVLDAARRARHYSILADDASPYEKLRYRSGQIVRRSTDSMMRLLGGEAASRYIGHDAEWRHRNDWISRQFLVARPQPQTVFGRLRARIAGNLAPGGKVLSRPHYSPQPYEQIIRVSRAEGREDYAVRFEIEKRNVEARIRGRKLRLLTATIGFLAAVAAAVILARGGAGGALQAWPELVLVSAAIFLGVTYFLDAANLIMRHCFGYLMRPFNAVLTLFALLGIGWWGVSLANDQRMMVIDFSPVATMATTSAEAVVLGSGAGESVISDVHCAGEINEPLYALDVLIPLIDLRQEEKCEVGVASVPVTNGEIKDRSALWSFAKAFYAILGWIVVSLVILTFVNTFRTKSEG